MVFNGMDRAIAVFGLGYVGLPLAVELGKRYTTVGFDVKRERIAELEKGIDRTGEVNAEAFRAVSYTHLRAHET